MTVPCLLVAARRWQGSGHCWWDWGVRMGEQLLPEGAWRQARAARQSRTVNSLAPSQGFQWTAVKSQGTFAASTFIKNWIFHLLETRLRTRVFPCSSGWLSPPMPPLFSVQNSFQFNVLSGNFQPQLGCTLVQRASRLTCSHMIRF